MQRELRVYPNGDQEEGFELWVRKGQCIQCGKCCELHWRLNYIGRGARGEDAPPVGSKGSEKDPSKILNPMAVENWEGYWRFWQRWDHETEHVPCAAYDEETGICVHHNDPERPEICRKWPVMPSDIEAFPECGFSFEKVEDQQ
jgi:Fe-S-cluster containining protein